MADGEWLSWFGLPAEYLKTIIFVAVAGFFFAGTL